MSVDIRAWVKGTEITSRLEKVKFSKAISSDPQPATLFTWGAPPMTLNFDRFKTDGDNACATIDPWAAEDGDDAATDSNIIHDIDVTSDVCSLYIKDASRTTQQKINKELPVTITAGKVIRVKIKPMTCTGGSANCFLGIQLNEGSDVGAHVLLQLAYVPPGLVDGQIFTKNSVDDQTTTAGATDTGKNLDLDGIQYLWLQIQSGLATFKVAVTTASTDTPSYSAALDMPNTLSLGWDTIRLYTPDANDDGGVVTASIDEDFETFTPAATKIRDANGWDAWTEYASCSFQSVSDGGTGFYGQLIDGSGTDGPLPTKSITAHTMANGEYVEFDFDVTTSGTSGGFACCLMSGANYAMIAFVKGNANPSYITMHDNATYRDVSLGMNINTHRLTMRLTRVSATTWKVAYSIDGGAFSDSTTYSTSALIDLDANQIDGIQLRTQGSQTCDVTFRTIDASWTTTTVYTAKTLEAYIYELYSDEVISFDEQQFSAVEIMVGGKHAWRGDVRDIEITESPVPRYSLMCKDLMQRLVDMKCRESFKLGSGNIDGAVANNRITVDGIDADLPALDAWLGKGCVIRHTGTENKYHDGSGLKAYQDLSATGYGVTGTLSLGAYTDTYDYPNGTRHQRQYLFDADHAWVTVSYTLRKQIPAGTHDLKKAVLKASYCVDTYGFGATTIAMRVKNHTTGSWFTVDSRDYANVYWPFGFSGYITVNKDLAQYGLDLEKFVYDDGTYWYIDIQYYMRAPSGMSMKLSVDNQILDLDTTTDAHDPVESLITKVDSINSYIWLDHYPFVENYVSDNDNIQIGQDIANIVSAGASACNVFDSVIVPDAAFRWLYQDMKGNTWFSIIDKCAKIIGGYFYYQLDEDNGEASFYFVESLTEARDEQHYNVGEEGDDIDDLPFWTVSNGANGDADIHFDDDDGEQGSRCARLSYTAGDDPVEALFEPGEVNEIEFAVRVPTADGTSAVHVRNAAESALFLRVQPNYDNAGTDKTRIQLVDSEETETDLVDIAVVGQDDYIIVKLEFPTSASVTVSYKFTSDLDFTEIGTYDTDDCDLISNDIEILYTSGNVAAKPMYVGYLKAVMPIDSTGEEITSRQDPTRQEHADKIRSVLVIGKNDEYEVIVDSTSPIELQEVDETLISPAAVKNRAMAIAAKRDENSRSIRFDPTDVNRNFNIGDFVTITANTVEYADRVIRRAEFEADANKRVGNWTLDVDTGETFGRELLQKTYQGISKTVRDIQVNRINE